MGYRPEGAGTPSEARRKDEGLPPMSLKENPMALSRLSPEANYFMLPSIIAVTRWRLVARGTVRIPNAAFSRWRHVPRWNVWMRGSVYRWIVGWKG